MTFVIDASVVGGWMFKDERHAIFDIALDSLMQDTALAPVHWWFEVRNMLAIGERRRRISKEAVTEFLDWLRNLPIVVAPFPNELEVLSLARSHGLTFYDAAYCELARREGVALATLDLRLTRAALAEGVVLIGSH